MATLPEVKMLQLGEFTLPINPETITVKLSKKVVRHEIPGRDGDVVQVLGMKSKEITWDGYLMPTIGNTATADELARKLMFEYEKKEVLNLVIPFSISSVSDSTQVVIQDLSISDTAGRYEWRDYSITCIEWRAPEVKINQVTLLNRDELEQLTSTLKKREQLQQ